MGKLKLAKFDDVDKLNSFVDTVEVIDIKVYKCDFDDIGYANRDLLFKKNYCFEYIVFYKNCEKTNGEKLLAEWKDNTDYNNIDLDGEKIIFEDTGNSSIEITSTKINVWHCSSNSDAEINETVLNLMCKTMGYLKEKKNEV